MFRKGLFIDCGECSQAFQGVALNIVEKKLCRSTFLQRATKGEKLSRK